MAGEEVAGVVGEEGGLALVDWSLGGEAPAELALFGIGLVAVSEEEVVVAAARALVFVIAVVLRVAVLHGDPLFEPVLGEDLVAEVPLAHVGGAVVGVGDELVETRGLRAERDVVGDAAALVGPEAGHDGAARGRGDGLGDVGLVEHVALGGELVEVGGLDLPVPVDGHGVGALLVGPDEQEIGLPAGTGG